MDLQALGKRLHFYTWLQLLPVMILGVGLLVRSIQYGANRALWADEAKLALNILHRSYLDLLRPLDYDQVAPPGFLWIEKLAVQLLGSGEYALRLFPFVAGLLSLLLFYQLTRWCLSNIAVWMALVFFVCSEDLIYYASEVKPYASDVVIALGLCLLLIRFHNPEPPDPEPPARGSFSTVLLPMLVGAIALWVSYPAVFVLVGIELAVLITPLIHRTHNKGRSPTPQRSTQQKSTRQGLRLQQRLLLYGGWMVSFLALYIVALSNHPSASTLSTSWDYSFPQSGTDVDWLFSALKRFFRNPLRFPDVIDELAIATCFLGGVALWRRRPIVFWMGLVPVAITLGASYLQKYPFRDRLVLFLVPFFLLVMAAGLAYGWQIARFKFGKLIVSGLMLVLFSVPVWNATRLLIHPYQFEDIRPLMAYIQTHRQPGDRIYVFQKSQFQFAYYAPRYGFQPDEYQVGADPDVVAERDFSAEKREVYRNDINTLRGQKRVWFVVADTSLREDTQFIVSYLDKIGRRTDSLSTDQPASFVYLYDLSFYSRSQVD